MIMGCSLSKALDILTKPVSEGGLGKVVDANFEPIDYRTQILLLITVSTPSIMQLTVH